VNTPIDGNRSHRGMGRVIAALVACFALASFWLGAQPASAAPYAVGDVFAAIGNGKAKVFDPSTGNLKQTLNDGSGSSFTTGMCFDAAGNFYLTDFDSNISKFDSNGNLVDATFASYSGSAESCVWNASNQMYVGGPGGPIQKYNSSGALLATFTTAGAGGTGGTDWIDLAADQCTMFYSDEGTAVGRFDVCTNTQLTDFATDLPGPCYALRIRPNGEVMVACQPVQRLNSSGTVIQSYSNANGKFALNLDPDGTSFWTGDLGGFTNDIFRFNIASGNQLKNFSSNAESGLFGLAVFGEVTQGALQGTISARGTVQTVQGGPIGFSAANNCILSQSTRPSIIGTTAGGKIWTKSAVSQSTCTDQPPASPLDFDTQTGTATGTFGPSAPGGRNGQSGTLAWTYHDGSTDTVQFTLKDSSNTVVFQAAQQTPSAYRGSPGGVWTFGP
jgi:hypothetical protein